MRAQVGKFTLGGDGLCVGFDSADAVSQEYSGSSPFKGGTILFVGVTVERRSYLDLEKMAIRLRRTFGFLWRCNTARTMTISSSTRK
jgi:arylsulfatase